MKHEYDIFIPTVDNEGKPFPAKSTLAIKLSLIERFGGLTDTAHKNKGFWKIGNAVVRDEIVVWRILSEEGQAGDEYLRDVKKSLEKALEQETILIVKRQVDYL